MQQFRIKNKSNEKIYKVHINRETSTSTSHEKNKLQHKHARKLIYARCNGNCHDLVALLQQSQMRECVLTPQLHTDSTMLLALITSLSIKLYILISVVATALLT